MSIFDAFLYNKEGKKAYRLHVEGNQAIDKGEIEVARQKHNEALELYAISYSKGERAVNILMAYAVLLMRFDRCAEAEKYLLEVEKMKLDPKDRKQLRINYAVCQWRLGQLDKAIENLEYAGANGSTSTIMTTLGYLYIEKGKLTGDYSKALEYNNEALEYDEEDAGILDNMGQLYLNTGDTDKAYEYFAKAYKYKKNQAPTLYYIAKINLERGNIEKAKAFIDECLSNGNFSALCTVPKAQAEELKAEIYSRL